MERPSSSSADRFAEALTRAAVRALGRDELDAGTIVVSDPGRAGSTSAMCYPGARRSIVWVAPEMAARLGVLERPEPLSIEGFAALAARLGGAPGGTGTFRVLEGAPVDPAGSASLTIRDLDRTAAGDRGLIEDFIAACPEDDLDEAELEMEELDPRILAVIDDHGAIAAYASGRPWGYNEDFDDVAVITRPGRRGLGLGASAVAAFASRLHADGRYPLYNCNDENTGSARLAESLGFTVAQQVVAARFT